MISFENVSKTFGTGESALTEINLLIKGGEFVFIVGPSGSGKTTLFRLLTREMLPTHGVITLGDINLTKLSRNKIPRLRRKIGVIFQDLKLLNDRTIYENIALPLLIAGIDGKKAQERVKEVMTQVAILEHKDKFPVQLSGGELQRTAIARALVLTPEIIIADEPTGNLDAATSWEIVRILQEINNNGTIVLMATHNADIIKSLKKRVIMLENGKIVKDDAGEGVAPEKKEDHEKNNEEHGKKHHAAHEKKEEKL